MTFATTIVALIILAAIGFGLYVTNYGRAGNSTSVIMTSLETSVSASESSTQSPSGQTSSSTNEAEMFSPSSGAMISNAWLLTAELGMNEYALSIHAEGLEHGGDYIVEGTLASSTMATVPVSSESSTMNSTSASEFTADMNGTATYWIILNQSPSTAFESIQVLYLPNMSMQNATTVATVSLTRMMTTATTSMH
jgi:hypothetical protein